MTSARPEQTATSALDPQDVYLFAEGTHERAWQFLGAHLREIDGVSGVLFVVWAPEASSVAVVGDFNGWDLAAHPMRPHGQSGLWEIFVPGVLSGQHYKFAIRARNGESLPLKTDPYARFLQSPGADASIVSESGSHTWGDAEWMRTRAARQSRDAPISIYEVHAGSWRRHADGRMLSYRELAAELVPYVREMGFTHIELLPITEHPFDGSWGYQPVGMYAPTSRFGGPDDFRFFIDCCHQAGIGVLLDWVPAHFPSDAHGLARFDGSCLYEHEDPRQGFHRDWNTLIFNYGRNEVISYLLSNALFWIGEFHLDGLRVDAVASMLYLDYSRGPGDWIPNAQGGNQNLEAIAFLQRLNERIYRNFPDCLSIAEESTAWPGVSHPTSAGGLGFGYKWNMGWMNDTLRYMAQDPVHRRFHHDAMRFGVVYAFSENFMLPLSHDEMVHGKGSLIGKMPGDEWQRHANLRAYLGFMWTHPGKKLLFMGAEFAQLREWSHERALDWHLLEAPLHAGTQRLVRDLNTLYRELPALHAQDCETGGFEWVQADDAAHSVYAFLRHGGGGHCLVVCNFTPVPREAYRLGVPASGFYRERLNTDSALYGGSNAGNVGGVQAQAMASHGRAHSVLLHLPPLSTLVLVGGEH